MQKTNTNETPSSSFAKKKNVRNLNSSKVIDEEVHSSAESSPDSPKETYRIS